VAGSSGLLALREEARLLKSRAFADSTKASYRTHLLTYLRFCIHYGVEPVPATQNTIICYTAHLARSLAPVSVNIYMNIVRILHEEAGLQNPLALNYEFNMVKRGLRRVKGVPPRQKAPITIPILIKLHGDVDFCLNSEKAFWCAILIGFFGFLRKSSLFPLSVATESGKRLNRGDVS
jgi:hypothetical protein